MNRRSHPRLWHFLWCLQFAFCIVFGVVLLLLNATAVIGAFLTRDPSGLAAVSVINAVVAAFVWFYRRFIMHRGAA